MPVYEEELQFLYNEILGNCSIDQEVEAHNSLGTCYKFVLINISGQKYYDKNAFFCRRVEKW